MSDASTIWKLAQQYAVNPARRTAQSVYDIGTSPVRALGHPSVQSALFGTPPGQGSPHPGVLDFTPLLGIAPFIRGAGGAGANMPIPRLPPRVKPHKVEGMLEDIGRGRREMIAGKRLVSDDPIANAAEFGRPWLEIEPEMYRLRSQQAIHQREFPSSSAGEELQRSWRARANELHAALSNLHEQGTMRSRAEGLAPHDMVTGMAPNVITERSFVEGLLRDAMYLFMGAKAPTQQPGTRREVLTLQQQRQIAGASER